MKRERRKCPRRRLAGNIVYVLDKNSAKQATLSDFSAGGLRLSYLPGEAIDHQWTLVDICSGAQPHTCVSGVVCETVYDITSLMENGTFSGMDMRVSGVRFDNLTEAQRKRLEMLLANSSQCQTGGQEATGNSLVAGKKHPVDKG